jgi:2-oxoglutarate ferredoxin oxidoreductase subunit beta
MASDSDPIPVGILYRNEEVPCYEEVRASTVLRTPELVRTGLDKEFDKYTIWPQGMEPEAQARA